VPTRASLTNCSVLEGSAIAQVAPAGLPVIVIKPVEADDDEPVVKVIPVQPAKSDEPVTKLSISSPGPGVALPRSSTVVVPL